MRESLLNYSEQLQIFAQTGDEAAFRSVVDHFAPAVLASARRRCSGNPELADEICQDAFALLARKADSLSRHPFLLGWLLKTVKLRALHATRTEINRTKRMKKLAENAEWTTDSSRPNCGAEESWSRALPILDGAIDELPAGDRKVVQLRYLQGASFNEIAEATGMKPGACQMRATRAVEKLRKILGRRGFVFTAAALAGGLAAHGSRTLARSTTEAISQGALAGAPHISHAAVAAHTLQIMVYGKQMLITGAVVLAAMCAILGIQWEANQRLRSEVRSLEARLGDPVPWMMTADTAQTPFAPREDDSSTRSLPDSQEEMRRFVRTIDQAYRTDDLTLAQEMAKSGFFDLDAGGLKQLIEVTDALPELDGARLVRGYALTKLADTDPEHAIEKAGHHTGSLQSVLSRWGAKDPSAALAWFDRRVAEGDQGDGSVELRGREELLKALASGIARADLDEALGLVANLDPDDTKGVIYALDGIIGTLHETDKVFEVAGRVNDWPEGDLRNRALLRLATQVGELGSLDDGTRLLEGLRLDPDEQVPLLKAISGRRLYISSEIASKTAAWVLESAPEGSRSDLVSGIVEDWARHDTNAAASWVATLERGDTRDSAVSRLVANSAHKDPRAAFEWAKTIDAQDARDRSLGFVYRSWWRRDQAAADAAWKEGGFSVPEP